MAKDNNLKDLLTSVANAIRTKKGTSELINPQNFDAEIINIKPNLQSKTATPTTDSQTITADSGYDGLSSVEIDAVTSAIDSNITPTNIRAGVTVLGVEGNLEPDKPDQSKTVAPTTSSQIVVADTGYELASVTVEAVDSSIDSNITAANIKKDVTILGVTGTLESGSLPEYMSAKNFTFDGNACTGYVGDVSVPEIIIPKSYSFFETQEQLLGSYVNRDTIFSETNSNISNITLCNEDGTNVHSYSSTSSLRDVGPRDFASVDKILIKQLIYSYNFITQSAVKTYIKNILAVPIYYRNVVYNNADDFLKAYFTSKQLTEFGGTITVKHFKDGEDVTVTAISQKTAETSGFKGFTGNIIIPKSISTINNYAFYLCSSVKNFFIDTPNYIGIRGFQDCKGLKHIELGALESIYDYSFYNSGIKSINIPNSVKTIGNGAFSYCDNLKNVHIGSGVEQISGNPFKSNNLLSEIIIDENNTVYDSRNDCNAIIETASKTLIAGCNNSTIPDGVTSIGREAFRDCDGLTSISIPNSVTSIGEYAFWSCNGLQSINIPDSLTSIENYVFYGCASLTSVTIPNSVTSIGNGAFSSCSSLTTMTIKATTPPTLKSTDAISTATTTIYIPAGTLEAYQTATNWSSFASKFVELSE